MVENADRLGREVFGPGAARSWPSGTRSSARCAGRAPSGRSSSCATGRPASRSCRTTPPAPRTPRWPRCRGVPRRGLLPFVNGSRTHVVPALNITDEEARYGLALLDEALAEVEARALSPPPDPDGARRDQVAGPAPARRRTRRDLRQVDDGRAQLRHDDGRRDRPGLSVAGSSAARPRCRGRCAAAGRPRRPGRAARPAAVKSGSRRAGPAAAGTGRCRRPVDARPASLDHDHPAQRRPAGCAPPGRPGRSPAGSPRRLAGRRTVAAGTAAAISSAACTRSPATPQRRLRRSGELERLVGGLRRRPRARRPRHASRRAARERRDDVRRRPRAWPGAGRRAHERDGERDGPADERVLPPARRTRRPAAAAPRRTRPAAPPG